MSNKTQLQTNNTKLDALITRVNSAKDVAASLPEAGGGSGGSVETCTVTIRNSSELWIFYTSINSDGVCEGCYDQGSADEFVISAVKNTWIIVVDDDWAYDLANTNINNMDFLALYNQAGNCVFKVIEDDASMEFVLW